MISIAISWYYEKLKLITFTEPKTEKQASRLGIL